MSALCLAWSFCSASSCCSLICSTSLSRDTFLKHTNSFLLEWYKSQNTIAPISWLLTLHWINITELQYFSIALAHFSKKSQHSLNCECKCHNCLLELQNFIACLQKYMNICIYTEHLFSYKCITYKVKYFLSNYCTFHICYVTTNTQNNIHGKHYSWWTSCHSCWSG